MPSLRNLCAQSHKTAAFPSPVFQVLEAGNQPGGRLSLPPSIAAAVLEYGEREVPDEHGGLPHRKQSGLYAMCDNRRTSVREGVTKE
jgi:hypothetical protein